MRSEYNNEDTFEGGHGFSYAISLELSNILKKEMVEVAYATIFDKKSNQSTQES